MGQEASIKEHYGIGLQDDELILIETYIKENHPDFSPQSDTWYNYLNSVIFSDIEHFDLDIEFIDYKNVAIGFNPTFFNRSCKTTLKSIVTTVEIPLQVQKDWKKIAAFLKCCGVKPKKPALARWAVYQ